MVATCNGIAPIRPQPAHVENPKAGQQKWRAAAECIDRSITVRISANVTGHFGHRDRRHGRASARSFRQLERT